ncbi:MAG: TIGR04086 family membrane protein [Firmicutes bacterium]|nr:TIGR04086 family membrane protein [Bacillota bacterium]
MRVAWRSSHGGEGGGLGVGSVLQGVGAAFVLALLLSAAVGLAVAWTPRWDASDGLLKGLNLVAVAAGGFYAGRRTKRLGWLHGGLVGLVYVLLVTWMMVPEFGLAQLATVVWLREALYACLAGGAGGVAGVL